MPSTSAYMLQNVQDIQKDDISINLIAILIKRFDHGMGTPFEFSFGQKYPWH